MIVIMGVGTRFTLYFLLGSLETATASSVKAFLSELQAIDSRPLKIASGSLPKQAVTYEHGHKMPQKHQELCKVVETRNQTWKGSTQAEHARPGVLENRECWSQSIR